MGQTMSGYEPTGETHDEAEIARLHREHEKAMREYHGRALVYGEKHAQEWLAENTAFIPGVRGTVRP